MENNSRAERMTDEDDGLLRFNRVHQLAKVEDVVGNRVTAADGPVGVAMTTEIERDHMKMFTEVERDKIPAAAVVAAAVDQDSDRQIVVTPVNVGRVPETL